MTTQGWRTVLLGLVLAVLVVPFGGPYALPGILVIAALVAFDLWRQAVARDRVASGVAATPRPDRPALERVGIVVIGFVVFIAVVVVIQSLT